MKKYLFFCSVVFVSVIGDIAAAPFTAGITALNRQHDATAFRAWKRIADRGDAEGQNNIAYLYERGMGVKQSYQNAKIWYELAAAQGLPEAKHNLAMLTYQGHINGRDTKIRRMVPRSG